jgi:hypothetical protein
MNDTPETDKVICCHTKVYGMIGEYVEAQFARKLERERDEAREYADKLAEGLPEGMLPKDVEVLREANCGLASELTAVIEQRDRLADQIEANYKGTLMLERMVYQLREQRDRLAEALERILSYQGRFAEEDPESIAAEALAAVKGGSDECR